MIVEVNILVYAATVTVIAYAGIKLLGHLHTRKERRMNAESLAKSEQLLAANGYKACLYLPGLGIENEEISNACAEVFRSGRRLIIPPNGELVGKISWDTLEGRMPEAAQKKSHLTLVVSNGRKME